MSTHTAAASDRSRVWIQVAAGLKNPQMRKVLGRVLLEDQQALSEGGKQTAKNLARWEQIGLILHDARGHWVVDQSLLEQTLQAAARPQSEREGIGRFFDENGLHTFPAKPAQRLEVFRYLRDQVLRAQEQVDERELNDRLGEFHPDTALIRRHLVDHGLLVRTPDGSSYRRPEAS